MKTLIPFAALASVAAGIAMFVWFDDGSVSTSAATVPSPTTVSRAIGDESGPRLVEGTRRHVGVFGLSKGRKIRLSTAETVDGMACLIEEDDIGAGSSCLDDGLFARRKVELLVSSQGGPGKFSELHVAGISAPGIRTITLVKTDGSVVRLDLGASRAFVYESSAADLEERIYPTALRLYAASGRLVETLTFPAGG